MEMIDTGKLRFEVVKDIQECERLWKEIATIQTLYDEWDLRYLFYKGETFPLEFISAYYGEEFVGLVPLQYNPEQKKYEVFGGYFMEYNRIFIKPGYESILDSLLAQIPKPCIIRSMTGENDKIRSLEIDDYSYLTPLEGINSFEDYLQKYFSSKSRNQFRRKLKKVELNNPRIEYGRKEDMGLLIDYNIQLFPTDSHFFDKNIKQAFLDLLDSKFEIHMISVFVGEQIESVSISVLHNGIFYYLLSGTNRESVVDLGTFLVHKTMERGMELGAKFFDAGRSDCNWKERWHLQKVPQYKFEKN